MTLLIAGISLILLAGLTVAAFSRHPSFGEAAFRVLVVLGCALGAIPAAAVLAGASVPDLRIAGAVPGGEWVFGIDALSAIFLIAIFVVGAACALYGVAYAGHERSRRPVSGAHALVALLVAALALVVTARAVVPFLIAWEVMAVAGYLTIIFEPERAEVRRGGLLYLVATHTGTLALFALFAVWGNGAIDLTFASLAAHPPSSAAAIAVVLWLALAGFGVKAGIVPLHFWLPEAHAAAPSHISAIMSGLVIKMGIYGLMRVIVLLVSPPIWFGWVLLALGVVSGILGVIWALAQHDLKRLLAFHSVENIGIILLGMGAGVLGVAYGHPVMAGLGFAGAAFHTLNHALFKSLLFLGAGSVAHATGTRDIERLGGLAKRMPRTAVTFLIGSVAIVGLPPLNGFLSEWLVYRSLFQGGVVTGGARFAVVAAVALALIGGLALACFVKVVAVVFLGSPRDPAAAKARESVPGITRPLVWLAGACIIIGLLPALALPPVLRAGSLLAGGLSPDAIRVAAAANGAVTVFVLVLATGIAIACAALRALSGRRRALASVNTWACGYAVPPTARMQYTASSFAAPVLTLFRPIAGVSVQRTSRTFVTHVVDPVLVGLILPGWRGVRHAADRIRRVHRGRISLQLAYVAAAVIVLLVYLVVRGGAT